MTKHWFQNRVIDAFTTDDASERSEASQASGVGIVGPRDPPSQR